MSNVLFWLVAGTALLYVPLAATYMWFAFDADAPRLQEALNARVNGHAYATGPGSVNALRAGTYSDHRTVMALHTTLGALALGLAVVQFARAVRARPALHRWLGRAALASMTVSMLSGLLFLTQAPVPEFPGSLAFRLQLWLLALSTLGSAALALSAIRRGDMQAHQAWMGLHVSFLMTAPLLRAFWIGAGQLIPGNPLVGNIHLGAVLLAVLAPAAGAAGFMLAQSSPGIPVRSADGLKPAMPLAVVAVLGCAALVLWRWLFAGRTETDSVVWFHVAPVAAYFLACAIGRGRARAVGDGKRQQDWRRLMVGAAASPWIVLLLAAITAAQLGPSEALMAGLMVGAGAPLVASFALVVATSSRVQITQQRLEPQKGLR